MLDRYSFDVRFFTEIERFDRHLEKLRRGPEEERVHYVSHLLAELPARRARAARACASGADVICEKPLVINPWNLDALEELEHETGRRVYTVLQLRLHPSLVALRSGCWPTAGRRHDGRLTYVTARGALVRRVVEGRRGAVRRHRHEHRHPLLRPAALAVRSASALATCTCASRRAMAGVLELERARRALVPVDRSARPAVRAAARRRTTFRSITVDGEEIEFSDGFTDLHTRVYQEMLAGRGFGIDDARPSIELAHRIRQRRR